ncbi:MAG TPA: SDR family oxidoreductase [Dehalococcoidia bacterium]|nr:SDR family oxidoreductase [Dehalococcoidia bacterium]
MNLAGKVVVITGASAGVGRATAREFAARGARIGLIARGAERLEDARRECLEAGTYAAAFSADVADADRIEAAAASFEEELGPIDIWVNNAMTSVFSPVSDMTPEEYRRVTEVTYLGFVHGTMSALRRMKPRNRGIIIQVSSALAYRGIPLQSAYCASKHAIKGFTESLRAELLHDKSAVKVRTVDLPAVNTPQFDWVKSKLSRRAQPVPPIFQPEVPARAIIWAVEHNRSMFLLGWPTVAAVWANRIFPSLVDRYLGKTGYDSQQTDEAEDSSRPDNLWAPVEGHQAAHGRFDARARADSSEFWVNTHRTALLAAGAAGGVAGVLATRHLHDHKEEP